MSEKRPQKTDPDAVFDEEEALGKAYDGRMLRRLWGYVIPYRGQVAATLLVSLPIFVLEVAPAWIIREGLNRLAPGESDAGPSPFVLLFDRFQGLLEAPAGLPTVPWLAFLLIVAMMLGAALRFGQLMLMARTGQLAVRDLRRDVFAHILSLQLAFFDRYPVGRLVTRASNDAENIAEMFSQGIIAAITDVFFMVGFAVVLWSFIPELALPVFAVVPVLAALALLFRWRIREAFRKVRVRIARINATVQESVTGMKVVQLFGRETRNHRDFDDLNASHRDAWLESIRYDAALFSVVEVAGGISVALILGYGFGLAKAGDLYVFIDLMRRFFLPLRDLSAKYSVMQSAMASCERVFGLMDTAPTITDKKIPIEAPPQAEGAQRAAGERSSVRPQAGGAQRAAGERSSSMTAPQSNRAPREGLGEVVFENVWFAYQDEDWILRDLSFRVAPGERAAFVGATGAGKTTIIKLLTRLYEVDRGRILLDGVDLRDMPQRELRRRVAMVLQDVFLFSGSIAANVGLERDDIGEDRIDAAIRAVQADRFVERLPGGTQSLLRERGGDLSAGQRQLLSFARALAHGADVLVLDEATSSVDIETETMVQAGLRALLEKQTALVIAHRLSTIQDADRIYVLHQGSVVESGRHDELMAAEGAYHRLYRLQFAQAVPNDRKADRESLSAG